MYVEVIYHYQSSIYYQVSPNGQFKNIYYRDIRCKQQDICDVYGYYKANKKVCLLSKTSPVID